ncbi:hypothetical protein HPG69_019221 [Diceros bicornis minor]|uniref:Uncharacterized protein n=1 Tax=Diceros bicornis minor TaxID=77932 RepID=A0A7J7FMB1_DICBM|nr:hypothetical protein HPG69_019221 [Diceros bicornis minor]
MSDSHGPEEQQDGQPASSHEVCPGWGGGGTRQIGCATPTSEWEHLERGPKTTAPAACDPRLSNHD